MTYRTAGAGTLALLAVCAVVVLLHQESAWRADEVQLLEAPTPGGADLMEDATGDASDDTANPPPATSMFMAPVGKEGDPVSQLLARAGAEAARAKVFSNGGNPAQSAQPVELLELGGTTPGQWPPTNGWTAGGGSPHLAQPQQPMPWPGGGRRPSYPFKTSSGNKGYDRGKSMSAWAKSKGVKVTAFPKHKFAPNSPYWQARGTVAHDKPDVPGAWPPTNGWVGGKAAIANAVASPASLMAQPAQGFNNHVATMKMRILQAQRRAAILAQRHEEIWRQRVAILQKVKKANAIRNRLKLIQKRHRVMRAAMRRAAIVRRIVMQKRKQAIMIAIQRRKIAMEHAAKARAVAMQRRHQTIMLALQKRKAASKLARAKATQNRERAIKKRRAQLRRAAFIMLQRKRRAAYQAAVARRIAIQKQQVEARKAQLQAAVRHEETMLLAAHRQLSHTQSKMMSQMAETAADAATNQALARVIPPESLMELERTGYSHKTAEMMDDMGNRIDRWASGTHGARAIKSHVKAMKSQAKVKKKKVKKTKVAAGIKQQVPFHSELLLQLSDDVIDDMLVQKAKLVKYTPKPAKLTGAQVRDALKTAKAAKSAAVSEAASAGIAGLANSKLDKEKAEADQIYAAANAKYKSKKKAKHAKKSHGKGSRKAKSIFDFRTVY